MSTGDADHTPPPSAEVTLPYVVTAWCLIKNGVNFTARSHLEKLIVLQMVKELHVFHGQKNPLTDPILRRMNTAHALIP
jgi:hypothetical protein